MKYPPSQTYPHHLSNQPKNPNNNNNGAPVSHRHHHGRGNFHHGNGHYNNHNSSSTNRYQDPNIPLSKTPPRGPQSSSQHPSQVNRSSSRNTNTSVVSGKKSNMNTSSSSYYSEHQQNNGTGRPRSFGPSPVSPGAANNHYGVLATNSYERNSSYNNNRDNTNHRSSMGGVQKDNYNGPNTLASSSSWDSRGAIENSNSDNNSHPYYKNHGSNSNNPQLNRGRGNSYDHPNPHQSRSQHERNSRNSTTGYTGDHESSGYGNSQSSSGPNDHSRTHSNHQSTGGDFDNPSSYNNRRSSYSSSDYHYQQQGRRGGLDDKRSSGYYNNEGKRSSLSPSPHQDYYTPHASSHPYSKDKEHSQNTQPFYNDNRSHGRPNNKNDSLKAPPLSSNHSIPGSTSLPMKNDHHGNQPGITRAVSSSFGEKSIKSQLSDVDKESDNMSHDFSHRRRDSDGSFQYRPRPNFRQNPHPPHHQPDYQHQNANNRHRYNQSDDGSIISRAGSDISWRQLNQVASIDEDKYRQGNGNRSSTTPTGQQTGREVPFQHPNSNASSLSNSPTEVETHNHKGGTTKNKLPPTPSKLTSLDSLSSVASIQVPIDTSESKDDDSNKHIDFDPNPDLMQCSSNSSTGSLLFKNPLVDSSSKRTREQREECDTNERMGENDADERAPSSSPTNLDNCDGRDQTDPRPNKKLRGANQDDPEVSKTEGYIESMSKFQISSNDLSQKKTDSSVRKEQTEGRKMNSTVSTSKENSKSNENESPKDGSGEYYDKIHTYSFSLESMPSFSKEINRPDSMCSTTNMPHPLAQSESQRRHSSGKRDQQGGMHSSMPSWDIQGQDSFGAGMTISSNDGSLGGRDGPPALSQSFSLNEYNISLSASIDRPPSDPQETGQGGHHSHTSRIRRNNSNSPHNNGLYNSTVDPNRHGDNKYEEPYHRGDTQNRAEVNNIGFTEARRGQQDSYQRRSHHGSRSPTQHPRSSSPPGSQYQNHGSSSWKPIEHSREGQNSHNPQARGHPYQNHEAQSRNTSHHQNSSSHPPSTMGGVNQTSSGSNYPHTPHNGPQGNHNVDKIMQTGSYSSNRAGNYASAQTSPHSNTTTPVPSQNHGQYNVHDRRPPNRSYPYESSGRSNNSPTGTQAPYHAHHQNSRHARMSHDHPNRHHSFHRGAPPQPPHGTPHTGHHGSNDSRVTHSFRPPMPEFHYSHVAKRPPPTIYVVSSQPGGRPTGAHPHHHPLHHNQGPIRKTNSIGGIYSWTKDDDLRLTEIMKKYKNPRDWDPIANEFGRGKT